MDATGNQRWLDIEGTRTAFRLMMEEKQQNKEKIQVLIYSEMVFVIFLLKKTYLWIMNEGGGTNLSRLGMTHPAINNQFDNVWFVHDDAGHADRLAPTDFAPTPVEKVKDNRNRHIKPSVALHGYENWRRPILVVVPRPVVPPIRLLLQHSARNARQAFQCAL